MRLELGQNLQQGLLQFPCNHDFSDLNEKIEEILGNQELYSYIVENARKTFNEKMKPENIALHLYDTFKTLKDIE